jgi:dolichol kinase
MSKKVIRSDEVIRKIIHVAFGTMFIILITLFGRTPVLYFLIACFVLGAIISYFLLKRASIPFFSSFVAQVERHYEKTLPGQGALVFFLATIILLIIFPQEIIVLGALFVSVYGDGFSSLVGKAFGKVSLPNKMTLEGSAAGIAVSAFFLSALFPLHISLITAVVAMGAEFLPIDDNFTIPLVAGLVLSFLL